MQMPFDIPIHQYLAWLSTPEVLPWVFIISGIVAAAWLFEKITSTIPLVGWLIKGLIHLGTYFGFFIGIVDLLLAYNVFRVAPDNMLMWLSLIAVGFSLVMRVLSKFPLAIILAISVGVYGTVIVYNLLGAYAENPMFAFLADYMELKYMLIVFFVIAAVVYAISALILGLMTLIGKIFASNPVSMVLGLLSIGVGIAILTGYYVITAPFLFL